MTSMLSLTKTVTAPTYDQIRKNTNFKKKHIPGVIETLKWLGAGAPHENFNGFSTPVAFNMNTYIEVDGHVDDNNTCGTNCCMAGAIRLFTRHKIPSTSKDGDTMERDFNLDDHEELYDLFYHYTGSDPYQAFITLYNYCMTGSVDWYDSELFQG